MKLVNLNQLLFHPKSSSLSFYYRPLGTSPDPSVLESFLSDVCAQLNLPEHEPFLKNLEKHRSTIKKLLGQHPDRSHGFFFCEAFQGYVVLENTVDPFFSLGEHFHVRPMLEELFVNAEFMLVNVSLYDIKIYRGDFHQVEIIQHYEFDQLPKNLEASGSARVYAPEYMGLVPYKTVLALRTIAQKVKDTIMYQSIPVLVTGLEDMKKHFTKHLGESAGVITHIHEDFYEKTCVQILERCKAFRPVVLDYYSAQLKDRLKRMMKSRKYISDLGEIIKAITQGKVVHLVLPPEQKLWGRVDLETGEFEVHRKPVKNSSIDILNELAEEVIKQGGQVQILRHQFFPQEAHALAILKG